MRADLLGELIVLRSGLQHSWGAVWLVLAGLTACTGWTLAGSLAGDRVVPGSRITAVLTIGFAVTWVLVDKRLEGPILLVFSDEHGLALSDLASVVGVLVAGLRLFRQ